MDEPNARSRVDLSIIVPVFNSEKTLRPLYDRIVATLERMGVAFEIIFVDDCSGDRSWSVLSELNLRDQRVIAIQLMRNFGQTGATMCGVVHAGGELLLTIDDDLQCPPEDIETLYRALENDPGADVYIGAPKQRRDKAWRQWGSRVSNRINNFIFHSDASLKLTSFRIMRRDALMPLLRLNTPHPSLGPLLLQVTRNIKNVTVGHARRTSGQSGYTVRKIAALATTRILDFSTLPLRLLALMGMIGFVLSLGSASYYFIRYLKGGIGVQGWTTTTLLLLLLSSFNFFAFGVVGEYLFRILQSVRMVPQFVVRRRLAKPDEPTDRSEEAVDA